MQSINLFISGIIQVILFSLIPFIWWFIKGRKESNFFCWLGIKKPIIKNKRRYTVTFLLIIVFFIFLQIISTLLVKDSDIATSQFYGQGISALIPALIYSFLQTGFSEEIFFRGFLTKRLIDKFGFKAGNFIQGILFGLVHGIMFLSLTGVIKAIIIVLITGVIGSLLGYINEKQSGGSIISSWLLHSLANVIASITVMFNLIK